MTIIDISRQEAAKINSAIYEIETVTNMIKLLLKEYNKPWWAINDEKSKFHEEELAGIKEHNDKIVESIKELIVYSNNHIDKSSSILCKVLIRKINEAENPNCYNEDDEIEDGASQ